MEYRIARSRHAKVVARMLVLPSAPDEPTIRIGRPGHWAKLRPASVNRQGSKGKWRFLIVVAGLGDLQPLIDWDIRVLHHLAPDGNIALDLVGVLRWRARNGPKTEGIERRFHIGQNDDFANLLLEK